MKIFRDDIEKIKNIDTRMIKEDRSRFIVDNRDTIQQIGVEIESFEQLGITD